MCCVMPIIKLVTNIIFKIYQTVKLLLFYHNSKMVICIPVSMYNHLAVQSSIVSILCYNIV